MLKQASGILHMGFGCELVLWSGEWLSTPQDPWGRPIGRRANYANTFGVTLGQGVSHWKLFVKLVVIEIDLLALHGLEH